MIASGLCGGASLALAVSVMIHPSLLTRIVLVGVLASTLAVLTPLPIARLQPILLRTSSSAAGSFGLVLSISLFSHTEPWSNVWERLWVHDDIRWGSAQEKGLSAGFFLFLASGVSTDWWLRSKFGESPDQKWDSYLAQYVANLPVESNRAGIFHPLASIWNKPPFKYPGPEPISQSESSRERDVNHLRKGRGDKWTGNGHIRKTKPRGNIKFRPLDDDSTDSETEVGDVSKGGARHVNLHPWLAGVGSAASTLSSTPTVLEDGVHSCVVVEKASRTRLSTSLEGSDLPDFSGHEVDITSDAKPAIHGADRTPPFLQNKAEHLEPLTDHPDNTPLKRHESTRWQSFWRDVNERIQHKEIP